MARSSQSAYQAFIFGFLLLLSFFNFASTTPLPEQDYHKSIAARDLTPITKARYEKYMTKYFPATDHYIFYTAHSIEQVKTFMKANTGYNFYDTIVETHGKLDHPWYKEFDETKDDDDAEAASEAMASVAKGDVLVFGGVRWKTDGPRSYFAINEIPDLHAGITSVCILFGRVRSLNHMEKDATDASKVIATEDASGKLTWKNGHKDGDKNASGASGVCNNPILSNPIIGPILGIIDGIACDSPPTTPKISNPSKGMALSIAMVTSVSPHGTSASVDNAWKFYTTKAGKAVGSCGETEGAEIKAESSDSPQGGENADPKNPPFPGGTFKLKIEGEACEYKNSGGNAGKLICPSRDISCKEDRLKSKAEGMLKCGNNQFFHAVVYCEF